jgi:prolyl-tRNA synthetase
MVGGTIMTHGDERGLKLPPAVAPVQVVIVPIYRSDDERSLVLSVAMKMRDSLAGDGVRVKVDDRDQHRPGYKFSEWELKGVPIRVEIGPKDVAADKVVLAHRISGEKEDRSVASAISDMAEILADAQLQLHRDATAFRDEHTHEAGDYEALKAGIGDEGGFWRGPWCGSEECEIKVSNDTSATIRYLPLQVEDPGGACVVCGQPGVERATWAKAY